jgi:hypothetical protein
MRNLLRSEDSFNKAMFDRETQFLLDELTRRTHNRAAGRLKSGQGGARISTVGRTRSTVVLPRHQYNPPTIFDLGQRDDDDDASMTQTEEDDDDDDDQEESARPARPHTASKTVHHNEFLSLLDQRIQEQRQELQDLATSSALPPQRADSDVMIVERPPNWTGHERRRQPALLTPPRRFTHRREDFDDVYDFADVDSPATPWRH